MTLKTKRIKSNRKWYMTIATLSLFIILGILFFLNSSKIFPTTAASKSVPVFTFDGSKIAGWWAGKNYNGQEGATKDYAGDEPVDKLPVASMNVFKGKQGEYSTACFVMFSYYDYQTDIAKLKAEKEAGASKGGAQFKNIGDTHSSINTIDGIKSYTLTKYELSGPGTENSMKGMSYGWAKLTNGYIQISGVCPTATELDDTAVVSKAVSLVKP